ncbi:conserved hypothetical protein [Xanthomonas campestris pv. raphani 756C]|nr:conserved hypothetical protein [Xanthomonas campestris pv. raphani 756C]
MQGQAWAARGWGCGHRDRPWSGHKGRSLTNTTGAATYPRRPMRASLG